MANTGAVRATESKVMSGVAMETEFQLLNARLSEKADNLELAEEQMWKLWAAYMGTAWTGEIDYPGSFNIRDTGKEIVQLQQAKQAATDPRVLAAIDDHIMEFLGEDLLDEVNQVEQHATTTPANRSAHIQQMIMDGYTDSQILQIHAEITQADITAAKQQLLNLNGE
jgi:hypothetical protein